MFPNPDAKRPHPDAMTRQELADAIGQPYARVYYWTAAGHGPKRAKPVVPPSYGHPTRKGEPAWFSPDDADELRQFLEALDTVQAMTGDRRASSYRRRGS